MTFKVTTGSKEDREAAMRAEVAETLLILSGCVAKVIFLNGGSETRRGTREYYEQLYERSNLYRVESNAFSVTIHSAILDTAEIPS
jgi:hypothetical protein